MPTIMAINVPLLLILLSFYLPDSIGKAGQVWGTGSILKCKGHEKVVLRKQKYTEQQLNKENSISCINENWNKIVIFTDYISKHGKDG